MAISISRRQPLFHLSAQARQSVLRNAAVQTYPAGSVVYRADDPPGGIYGVAAGALAVGFSAEEMSPHLLQLGAPGGWTGIVPFLTGGRRLADLRAASDCTLMHLPLSEMEAMALADPTAIRSFAQITVANLEVLIEVLRIVLLPGSERRIASALLFAMRSGVEPLPLSQDDVAVMANTSLRQVSAAVRRFAAAGWIEPGYRSIRVVAVDRLREIATGSSMPGGRSGRPR